MAMLVFNYYYCLFFNIDILKAMLLNFFFFILAFFSSIPLQAKTDFLDVVVKHSATLSSAHVTWLFVNVILISV